MQPKTRATRIATRHSKNAASPVAGKALTSSAAAELMWTYYRDSKHQFISKIRQHRERILAELIAGVPVDKVFEPYIKQAKPSKLLRRAA